MAPAIPATTAFSYYSAACCPVGMVGTEFRWRDTVHRQRSCADCLDCHEYDVAGGCGFLTAAVITESALANRNASLSANGWIGGLVASSATCAFIVPAEAIVIGSIAGALVTFSVEWFELRLEVDDPGGAVSVHAIGGIWGLLAVALFARFHSPV